MQAEEFINALTDRKITLLGVIESLKSLQSTKKEERKEALSLLAKILSEVPNGLLSEQEIKHCCDYFCSKMEDHHSLISPTLNGILALFQCNNISKDTIIFTLQHLFQKFICQSQVICDRRTYYLIFSFIIRKRKDVILTMGSSFVLGLIDAMDGEMNPRNLIICFQIVPLLISIYDCSLFYEEFFEILSCYFPVDFTPPVNDEHKITREDISNGLMSCLSFDSKFAPHLFPFLFEKLESDISLAKKDSFDLMTMFIPKCEIEEILKQTENIWSYIRREIYLAVDSELEDKAVNCLSSLIKKLCPPASSWEQDDALNKFINTIFTECQSHLQENDLRYLKQCSKIFLSCCNPLPARKVLLPKALDLYKEQYMLRNDCQKSDLMSYLIELMCIDEDCAANCKEFFTSLFSLDSIQCKIDALKGFRVLSLTCDDTQVLISSIFHYLNSNRDMQIRRECLNTLGPLYIRFPSLALDNLAEIEKIIHEAFNEEEYCLLPFLFSNFCINSVVSKKIILTFFDCMEKTNFDLRALDCYLEILQSTPSTRDFSVNLECQIVKRLLHMGISNIDKKAMPEIKQWTCSLSKIIQTIIANYDPNANNIMEEYCALVLNNCESLEWSNEEKKYFSLQNYGQDTSENDCFVVLLRGLFVSCPVTYISSFPSNLMERILKLILSSTAFDEKCHILIEIYSSILNKQESDKIPEFVTMLKNAINSAGLSCVTVSLLTWLIKALILKGRKEFEGLTYMLIEGLSSDEAISKTAINGFRIIMESSESSLSKECNSITSILYKQRFFMFSSTVLLKNYHLAEGNLKMSYCKALCYQIPYLPKAVLNDQLDQVFPLLLTCLIHVENSEITSTLPALLALCQDNLLILQPYMNELISTLSRLAVNSNFKAIRSQSLQCLYYLAFLPEAKSFKIEITRLLDKCLSDRKRCVRYEAVKTRNVWYLVAAPGGIG